MKLVFDNGEVVYQHISKDTFFRGFNDNLFLRRSCYQCKYAKRERVSDFTAGDYWGVTPNSVPAKQLELGVSIITVNSNKGLELLKEINDIFEYSRVSPELVIPHNRAFYSPAKYNKKRKLFFKLFDLIDFDKLVKILSISRIPKKLLIRLITNLIGKEKYNGILKRIKNRGSTKNRVVKNIEKP